MTTPCLSSFILHNLMDKKKSRYRLVLAKMLVKTWFNVVVGLFLVTPFVARFPNNGKQCGLL
jgi:hypothetical protein